MNKDPKIKALPFIPTENKVIVKLINVDDIPKKTKSHIIVPNTANKETNIDLFREHPFQGYIVAVSEGYFQNGIMIPLGYEIGQRIAITLRIQDRVEPFIYDGEKYAIIRSNEIEGIYENYKL